MSEEFQFVQFEEWKKKEKSEGEGNPINTSVLRLPDCYSVLAMVRTGDDVCFDQVIEVSAVKYQGGREIERYSELIRPEDYYLVSMEEMEKKEDYCIVDGGPVQYVKRKFTKETGITNQMLYHAKGGKVVSSQLREFLGEGPVIGEAISLQLAFINKLSDAKIENECVDLIRLAKRARKETYALTLLDLAVLYELPYGNKKRAEEISHLVNQVYQKLRADLIEEFGSIKQFERSMAPALVNYPEYVDCQTEGEHPFYNKVCVFTGTLTKMVRGNAMRLVRNCGGITGTSVTKKTQYLILGNKEYEQRLKGNKSTKLRKAEALLQEGASLHIISEDAFYKLVGFTES